MRILITSLKTNQQKYVICRICPGRDCSQYFSSIKSLTQHKRICSAPRVRKRKQQQVEQQVEEQQQPHTLEEFGFEVLEGFQSQGVEIIINLREWLKNPWEKI